MAWDKSLPSNSTKIRNYPTVLGANFAAIEEGGDTLQFWKSNYIERDAIPSAPPATPTRIDNTLQLYSRQVDSQRQLFLLDAESPANDIQLTRTTEVTVAASGQTFLPGGVLLQWFTGTAAASSNSSITFPTAFPNNIYNIQVTPSQASTSLSAVNLYVISGTVTTSGFDIRNPNAQAFTFYCQAIGT